MELIEPMMVRATDAITSVYGAFGKFTAENALELSDIDAVFITHEHSDHVAGLETFFKKFDIFLFFYFSL